KKGSLIGVDGRIQTRSYDDPEGKRVYITEVVADSVQFLESKGSPSSGGGQPSSQGAQGYNQNQNQQPYSNQGNQNQGNSNQGNQDNPFQDSGEPIDISDDDLPF